MVCPLVVVADDPAGLTTSRGGDRCDAGIPAVAEDDTTIEELHHGVAGHDDIVAVTGPAPAGDRQVASVSADDDLGVDTAAVVLSDGGDGLVVHRDRGAVDDPRVAVGR